MALTESQSSRLSATIAENAAAEAKSYAIKAGQAEDFSNQAQASAEAAAVSAISSHSSAVAAEEAMNITLGQTIATIRVPDGETLSVLPVASERKGKFPGFDPVTGDVKLIDISSTDASALALSLASSGGSELVGTPNGTVEDRFTSVETALADKASMDALSEKISGAVTFIGGGVLNSEKDFIYNNADLSWYFWSGAYDETGKVILPSSTPESTGGVGPGKWLNVGDTMLRSELAGPDGAGLVGFKKTNVASAISALPVFNKKFILVFNYGQSNNVGEPDKDGAGYDPSQLSPIPENCYYWSYDRDTGIGELKPQEDFMLHCTGQRSTGSAWNEFSQTMLTETGYGIIYVPCAKGATSLAQLSKGNAAGYYQNALDSYAALQASGALNDFDIEYVIAVFHQGETDMTLGTSRSDYQSLLRQFSQDVKSDFGISNFYMYLVGNPFTRTEKSWNGGVQAAQYFLGSNRPTGDRTVDVAYPYIKLIDTGCTTYTIRNGNLAVDNTHYTIKGYNAMGRRGAIEVAKDLLNASTVSPFSTSLNDTLRLPGFAQWIYTSAFINYSAANGWQLLTRDPPVSHARARLSNVYSLVVNADRLTINTGADNTYLLSSEANTGLQGGIRGLKAASSVSDKLIDVYLFARLEFRLDLTSPSITIPVKFLTSSGVDTLISSMISTSYDGSTDTITVNHPSTRSLPRVRFYSNSLSTVSSTSAVINIVKISDTQFKFKRSASGATESQVVVDIEDAMVNPSLYFFDGLTIGVTAVTAEKTS